MQNQHSRIIFSEEPNTYTEIISDTCELLRIDTENIGIDHIRTIIAEAYRHPKEGFSTKMILVTGQKITSEAQQSALKVLEEPPDNTHISIVLPKGTILLDTVLSRVQLESQTRSTEPKVFSKWLELSYEARLKEVAERLKHKDIDWLQSFRAGLMHYSKSGQVVPVSKDIELVIEHILTRGASNKMLIEHLALALPLTR